MQGNAINFVYLYRSRRRLWLNEEIAATLSDYHDAIGTFTMSRRWTSVDTIERLWSTDLHIQLFAPLSPLSFSHSWRAWLSVSIVRWRETRLIHRHAIFRLPLRISYILPMSFSSVKFCFIDEHFKRFDSSFFSFFFSSPNLFRPINP